VKSRGWPWVEQLLKNDTLVMSITPGIQPAVVKGERPIALMTSQFTAKSIEEGAPIALATDEMLFGSADLIGIIKDAPNPEGAELLVEYLISKEAQEIVRAHGPYSCRTDVAPPPGMPAIKDLKLRYKTAPTLDINAKDIADKFHGILRAVNAK
jgi:iron(III) transport system substrate-binding protein